MGYYKIKQGILQQNLSKYYKFEEAGKLCEYFNKFVNTLKKDREQVSPVDKYPWLDPEDKRRNMTDREILEKYIDLEMSCLNKEEKVEVMDMLYKYKEAFSLRDEIGTCPNIEVEIEVTDKSPFFIRPYHVREEDKVVMDKEMKRLCYMGILKEGFSAYSSPVMLISRKLTKDKRVVTDFRHLNVRIAKNNLAYPLVRDTFLTLGSLKCEVLSVLDLKDAFHSLQLSENSKKYCGILPYFGSSSYLYQRMPMGLNISPSIWQSYINAILSCLQSKKYCKAIMDDLILFTPSKESHMNKLEDILNALLKNGLKVSPKKCQLFRTSLQYMGNEIFIENKKVCVKPLRNRLEAIQRLQPPKTPKGCRSFAGVVNFLSMFCPELQRLLKPIYDLTRKGRPFHWGKEQQDSFIEIKCRLTKPPVLHMPNKTGRFHLYSDTSKFATGSALYQIQGGKPKLIAYASKRLPEAAKNYSIMELELCGLAINIASFSHLLKRVDFDAIVDHLALTHIIKSKAEPATTRIKRLLELISSYSFNLYYMKGKDMILSDFLSWQRNDDSDPSEIIPISFNAYNILEENRNSGMHEKNEGKFLIQTCSQAKMSGTTLLEVHGVRKKLDPNMRPEKQHALPKKGVTERPHIGQGRAGLRRKPEADCITQSSDVTRRILERSKIATGKTNNPQHISAMHDRGINNDKSFPPDVPLLLYPLHEPLQKKQNITSPNDQKTEINLDIEENSPFQEGIILELIQRPDKSFFQNPRKLRMS